MECWLPLADNNSRISIDTCQRGDDADALSGHLMYSSQNSSDIRRSLIFRHHL